MLGTKVLGLHQVTQNLYSCKFTLHRDGQTRQQVSKHVVHFQVMANKRRLLYSGNRWT